jgi:hypothetical protein
MRPKDIARRITGFSTPLGGVQWEPPEDERKVARAFLTFLEDRRVLFNPYQLEVEEQVIQSLLTIREKATDALARLTDRSQATAPIKAIRAACRRFLDEPHADYRHLEHRRWPRADLDRATGRTDSGFFVALGELRATVGMQVAALAVAYGLPVDDDLASILPAEDEGE